MVEVKESPEFIQTSLAGALCLGLERGKFLRGAKTTCLNLLLTYKEGCAASCAYCGLNRKREADISKTFIRVKWPVYSMEQVLTQMKNRQHPFKRMCLSMITHKYAMKDTCKIISNFKDETGIPISGLISPTVMKGKEDLIKIKNAGADHVGIAVDMATPELFEKYRGKGVGGPHRWDVYWKTLEDAVKVFGAGRAGVHLIVGLGETEEQMVKTIARAQDMGAPTHLFSFYPEAGSLLEDYLQPPMGQYRRVQLARYLINEGIIPEEYISYSPEGQIIDFGIDIKKYVDSGIPFMTSGCPGEDGMVACNRPFANERVNQAIRNYPFVPETGDIVDINSQLWDGVYAYERG